MPSPYAVPAMSRWAQGASPANSRRNHAAVIVPAGRLRNRGEALLWQGLALAGILLVILAFYNVALQGRAAPGI